MTGSTLPQSTAQITADPAMGSFSGGGGSSFLLQRGCQEGPLVLCRQEAYGGWFVCYVCFPTFSHLEIWQHLETSLPLSSLIQGPELDNL